MTAERFLKLYLRIAAIMLLLAIPAIVMPRAWMEWAHARLALGTMPPGPLVDYLARSASALYALHGGILWVCARDIRRFLPIIRFTAITGILFGLIMLGIDIAVGMPLFWIVTEGPFIIAGGVITLVACNRIPTYHSSLSTQHSALP